MIRKMQLQNFLSFHDSGLELQPLNVLVGPNGSGKSNLIESIALLKALPTELSSYLARARAEDWTWKGQTGGNPAVEALFEPIAAGEKGFLYHLGLNHSPQGWDLQEVLSSDRPNAGHRSPYEWMNRQGARGRVAERSEAANGAGGGEWQTQELEADQSAFQQFRDPSRYALLTRLSKKLSSISIYRGWNLLPDSPIRRPQSADAPNARLSNDGSNLALVLNRMQLDNSFNQVEQYLGRFLPGFERLLMQTEANTIQLFLKERGLDSVVPATRFSDGTLHMLCLLAVFCDPNPPPVICLEEPEVGLHPDAITLIAEAMREASERTQIVATTHSVALIDALSDQPENVVICEKGDDSSTEFRRLSTESLSVWLERYSLGELWRKGELGGAVWG